MNHQAKWGHASEGDPIWVSDPDEAYLEGTIASLSGNNVTVETKNGKRFVVDASIIHDRYTKPTVRFGGKKSEETARRLLPRSVSRPPQGFLNMDDLTPLNEASILANIEHRFRLDYIYTRTGPILIAMNPFKWLPIYGEEIVRQYHNRPYGSLPPHCFQEAEDAYQQLQLTKQNQSIIICGESGAGKTETTKLMLQYLSIVARDKSSSAGATGVANPRDKTIGEKLVQSNPLMEAFGNAKTVRNNNSSRFGKFTLLTFGKSFYISGGRVSNFLLEKSRVVRQQPAERNYHIFYQLIAGASSELRTRFYLPDAEGFEQFHYLAQSGCLRVDGVDDAQDLNTTRGAMEAVSIVRKEQDDMLQLVAGVLHLGNLDFDRSADGESSTLNEGTRETLRIAASLLGLDEEKLHEAVTTRVRQLPGGKTVRSPQTDVQSRDSRDALAKAIYNKLFDHLVVRINTAFDRDTNPSAPFIGILDIFGFEDMACNGFEQLLINFTNERLQLLFNETTFKMEEEEYMREQIQWDRTDFPDNQPCVDLIEKKPMGLLPVLDSECTRGMAANDAALVATYNKSFKAHHNYSVCGPATAWRRHNGSFTNDYDFAVIHFAGPVIYTCDSFVDKNRDALFDHVSSLIAESTFHLLAELFRTTDAASALRAGSFTVALRFTTQLANLMQTLQSCHARFVRCIKSNHLLQPQIMDKPGVLKQLICSGVMAAIEVRRAGFPTRIKYSDFVKDFRVFSVGFPKGYSRQEGLSHNRTRSQIKYAHLDSVDQSADKLSDREMTAKMMTHPVVVEAITAKQYRLGVTKLFLQADALVVLMSIKNRMLLPQVLRLQRWWIKQSHNVLAHKLTRAISQLADLHLKAEVNGIHRLRSVQIGLDEAGAAVRYAKGLGLLNPDVFRPAVNTAAHKLQILKEAIQHAIEAKEREAQQRAELLELLDSGRARLGHIQNGMRDLSLPTAELKQLCEKAGEGIDQRSGELLRAANREVFSLNPAFTTSITSAELQRNYNQAMEAAAANSEPDSSTQEEVLRLRRKKVEEVIGWVTDAETAFQALFGQQRLVDKARADAKATLATAKASLSTASAMVDDAGISQVLVVKQMLGAARDAVRSAEQSLEGNDIETMQLETHKAAYAVSELGGIVDMEKKRKEDDDQRADGSGVLDQARRRLEEIGREAEEAGVRQADAVVRAIKAVEAEISAVSLMASGDPKAFVAAAKAILTGPLEGVRSALRGEKARKEKNDQQREIELARLNPAILSIQDVQAAINQSFELAAEEALVAQVAAASRTLHELRSALETTDTVATLRDRVDNAVVQAAQAERSFNDVRQRLETRARDLAAARSQLQALDKRLQVITDSLRANDDGSPSLLAQLSEEIVVEARHALSDADRWLKRKDASGDGVRQAVAVAAERVDSVEKAIAASRQRVASAEKSREDEMNRLDLARCALTEFVASTLGNTGLGDKAVVRDAIVGTEQIIKSTVERLRKAVSMAWLAHDEIKQERAAVSEAIARVEQTEALILDEKKRYEAYLRDAKTNQTNLEFASEKLRELHKTVEDARIGRVAAVQQVMDDCEAAMEAASKAVTGSSEDAEPGRRAIGSLLDKLRKAEVTVATSKAQKEADEKERAETQNRLDNVLVRLQGVVAMIEAAGPAVRQLTDEMLEDATTAINTATKLLRRGDNLRDLGAAVRAAVQKVESVEAEAQAIKDRVATALKLKSTVAKKLVSLTETLALAVEKADVTGIRSSTPVVDGVLRQAEDALTAARQKSETDLEQWMAAGPTIARVVDDAAVKVEAAEEAVDEAVQRKERKEKERDNLQMDVDALVERHKLALQLSKEAGVAHIDSFQRAAEATDAEISTVNTAISEGSILPSLLNLTRLVATEEEVLSAQIRRMELRASDVKKAAAELPVLSDRLTKLDGTIQAASIALGVNIPSAAEAARSAAQKALWDVQRFVSEGLTSLSVPVPKPDAALNAIRKAEDQVAKHITAVNALADKRKDALARLRFLERRFADLEEEVADFCSKSDHLRVQLDADWSNNTCWWGSQTSHTQPDGAPFGRGGMKPIASVQVISENVSAAEAAMGQIKRRVEADLSAWVTQEGGSAAALFRALDETLAKLDRAAEVLDAEKVRVKREDQERLKASKALEVQMDRLSKLRVVAESRKLHGEPVLAEALHAAESAVEIVGKLLEGGNASASPMAMEVAAKKISEAEEVLEIEVQRRDRYEAQRRTARDDLEKLKLRAHALKETAEVLGQREVEPPVGMVDALAAVEKAVDRAGIAVTSGDLPIASINREVRVVVQRIEHAEKEVRREQVRREEVARLRLRQEEEERLRQAKLAEEERCRVETERIYRAQLENELERIADRLSAHKPVLNKLQASMGTAEDAIRAARARLNDGGLMAAQAAAQSALHLTSTFETTAHSIWGGKALGMASMRDLSDSAENGHHDRHMPMPGDLQTYLDRTTAAVEALAHNVDTLSQGLVHLQSSVREQWLVIDAQSQVLTAADSTARTTKLSSLAELQSELHPSKAASSHHHAHHPALNVDTHAKRRGQPAPVDDDDSVYGSASSVDGTPTIGRGAHMSVDGDGADGEPSPRSNAPRPASPKPELKALLSKYYSTSVLDRLKHVVTKGGVTLSDCIASGSLEGEAETLELFAGDAESYKLFAPLFEPVLHTCHPLYKQTAQHPIDLNYKHLDTVVDPDPTGQSVRKARLVVARNLVGYNLTPKMTVRQLKDVERAVVKALKSLTGPHAGTYTPMSQVMADKALQEELERAELPQTYRLAETAGSLSAWPEGRGVFLNADRSLCVFVNVEDHVTVIATSMAGEGRGGKQQAKEAFRTTTKVLKAMSKHLTFERYDKLGYITPSPAKLGTALAFSMVVSAPPDLDVEKVERRFQVCVDRGVEEQDEAEASSSANKDGGSCIVYSKLSLGVSEVETISQVLQCVNHVLHQQAPAAGV